VRAAAGCCQGSTGEGAYCAEHTEGTVELMRVFLLAEQTAHDVGWCDVALVVWQIFAEVGGYASMNYDDRCLYLCGRTGTWVQ
jgi:hypothetical protein